MTPIQTGQRHTAPVSLLGLTKTLLAATMFLLPAFFLPGLNDRTELPKAALFLFLTLGAAVTFTASWMFGSDVRSRSLPGGWWLLAFALAVSLSSLWSTGHVTSLLGQSGYVHHALPVLLGFVLFVILLTQVVGDEREATHFLFTLVLGSSLGVLLGVLQLAGISPFGWTDAPISNPLVTGSSNATLAIVAAALVTGVTLWLRRLSGALWRLLGWAGLVFSVLALLTVDSLGGWVATIVGVTVALAFTSLRRLTRNELALGMVVIAIAVIGILFPVNTWLGSGAGQDLRLDAGTSWAIVKSTLAHQPLLGSGPGTFFFDFVRFQPTTYNASPLSPLRFVKASDEALQLLATLGIVGVLVLVWLIVQTLLTVVRRSDELARRTRGDWHLMSALIGIWTGTTTAFFFVPATFMSFALFWITLGLCLVVLRRPSGERSVRHPAWRLGGALSFLLAVVFLIATTIWSVRLLLADRGLNRVNTAIQQAENLESVLGRIDNIIQLNPSASLPYLFRGQSELVYAQVLIQSQSAERSKIQALLNRVVPDAETAVSRDPGNPAILETVANLYKNLGAVTGNTGALVVSAYERAAKLQPNSAALRVNLGQVEYFIASAMKDQEGEADEIRNWIIKARSEFATALELQANNVDAGFGLVLVDELAGENDAALERLKALVQANPQSAGLWYELGLRSAGRKDTAGAKDAFTNAVILQPSLAQAHWELGLIAEAEKDFATARTEFELVQQLDPSNEEVVKKLESLPKP